MNGHRVLPVPSDYLKQIFMLINTVHTAQGYLLMQVWILVLAGTLFMGLAAFLFASGLFLLLEAKVQN
jgi:hypothetical protein